VKEEILGVREGKLHILLPFDLNENEKELLTYPKP
jgi:hypothetical protein